MSKSQYDTGVYQLENGNWAYRFKVFVDGKPVAHRRTKDATGNPFKTKKQAIKARQAAIVSVQTEKPLNDVPMMEMKTVKEVYQEYCENGRSDRAYATIKKQDSLWRIHIQEKFGDRFIDEISTGEVVDFLSHLYYEDGLAYRYVESFLKMFYLIFGQAYSRNYLAVDVYNKLCVNKDTKIHMPKLKVDDDLDIIAFTDEECATMDTYFKGTNAETAYMLGRYCGLRINECYGLKWEQVDLSDGTIRIEQQMAYQEGLIKLVPLKTRNARRTIYLPKKMIAYLSDLKIKQSAFSAIEIKQREQNQRFIHDGLGNAISSLELVNCLPNGKIQTVNSMKYHSRTLKSEYGIAFKYHYLRHTYGTHLAVMNTPAHLLCNQMGHGNIHVTEKYYIALSKAGIDVLKRNLEQL